MIRPVNIDYGRYRKFGYKLGQLVHCGHDFDCPLGTPIKAVAKGKVLFAGTASGFGSLNPSTLGWAVMILHTDSDGSQFVALYGHVDCKVKEGQDVAEGDVIGSVAKFFNGGVLLPHCHFGIWQGNTMPDTKWGYVSDLKSWVPPLDFFTQRGV